MAKKQKMYLIEFHINQGDSESVYALYRAATVADAINGWGNDYVDVSPTFITRIFKEA